MSKKNYLVYPCRTMRITQSYNGTTSHKPHNIGNPKDYPWDEGCLDTSRGYCYCPCDKMKIKRIYGVGGNGTNTLWLESTSKVYFADGSSGYFTMLITHPNDDDLKKLKVGKTFKRKEKICREGNDGATAYHFHFSGGKGKFTGNGWTLNSYGKYVLTTTGGAYKPEDLFFVDPDFTRVAENKGLKFKKLPVYELGTYKVSAVVLNVRTGPGANYNKNGTLVKGKKIKVVEIKGIWGRYDKNRWVCLDYCKII